LEVRIQSRKKAISTGKERTTGRPGNTQWLEKNLAEAEAEVVVARKALAGINDEDIEGRSFVAYDLPAMTKTITDDEEVASVLSRLKKKYPDLKPGK
jgi:ethanolamine ammonia-lyase large subunit